MRHPQVPSEKADLEMRLPAMWCEDEGANPEGPAVWHSNYPALEDCLRGLKRHRQKEMEVIARSQVEASGATKGLLKQGR